MPATLTSTSKASPCRSNSAATTEHRLSSSVTSSGTTSAEPPASATSERVRSLPSASISAIATCAPAAASTLAVARPSPLAAPVTRATRPFSDPSSTGSSVRRDRPANSLAEMSRTRRSAPSRRRGPHVGQRDRGQASSLDDRQQLVEDGRDRRLVGMADDDGLQPEPPLGGLHQVVPVDLPRVVEGAVPQRDGGVPQVGGDPVDPLVVRPEGRPQERGVLDAEHIAQER